MSYAVPIQIDFNHCRCTNFVQRYCFFCTYANKKGKKISAQVCADTFIMVPCVAFRRRSLTLFVALQLNALGYFLVQLGYFSSPALLLFRRALLLFRSGLTLFGLGLTLFLTINNRTEVVRLDKFGCA